MSAPYIFAPLSHSWAIFLFKKKSSTFSRNIIIFFKDGQDEFLKTEYLRPCCFKNKLWDKADKEKIQRNPKKSRIKYTSNGLSKKKFSIIFQKLIANSMGDLNLELQFRLFLSFPVFSKKWKPLLWLYEFRG
jgi:hypothetical protein